MCGELGVIGETESTGSEARFGEGCRTVWTEMGRRSRTVAVQGARMQTRHQTAWKEVPTDNVRDERRRCKEHRLHQALADGVYEVRFGRNAD